MKTCTLLLLTTRFRQIFSLTDQDPDDYLDSLVYEEKYKGDMNRIPLLENPDDFYKFFVNKFDLTFVQYRSSSGCTKCDSHLPAMYHTLDALEKFQRKGELRQKFAMVMLDCHKAQEPCQRYGVQKFPMYQIIRKDGLFGGTYRGKPASKEMINYLRYQAGPPSYLIKTEQKFREVTEHNDDKVSFIAFFKDKKDKNLKQYNKAVQEYKVDDVHRFYHMYTDDDMANDMAKYALDGKSTGLAVFRQTQYDSPSEPRKSVFKSEMEFFKDNIDKFVKAWGYGQAPHVSMRNRERIGWPHVILFVKDLDFKDKKGFKDHSMKWRERLLKIYKFNPTSKYRLSIGDMREFKELVNDDLQAYKWEDRDESEAVLAAFKSHKHRWVMPGTVSLEGDFSHVSMWLQQLYTGILDHHIKSEDFYPIVDPGEIQNICARQFNKEVVEEEEKDLMILVHAKYCSHCRAMFPSWKRLAGRLKNEDSIRVLSIEGFHNDLYDERYSELQKKVLEIQIFHSIISHFFCHSFFIALKRDFQQFGSNQLDSTKTRLRTRKMFAELIFTLNGWRN